MKRYFHLQILVSMLCLAAAAMRHHRVRSYVPPYRPGEQVLLHSLEPSVRAVRSGHPPPLRHVRGEGTRSREVGSRNQGEEFLLPPPPPPRGKAPSRSREATTFVGSPPLAKGEKDTWRGFHRPDETWNSGAVAAASSNVETRMIESDPAVRYEESVLEENKPHRFTWNADNPHFYQAKPTKKQLGLNSNTPWKYFQERPSFHTSASHSREASRS